MKQRWILGILAALIAVFFLSCTGFFEQDEEIIDFSKNSSNPGEPSQSYTKIYFKNLNNCAVDVFASYLKDYKIMTVRANETTLSIPWVQADNGFEFYFTYNIPISGVTFPYTQNKAYITTKIPKDLTTQVMVLPLSDITGAYDPLITDTLISLRNNNASAIRLYRGGSSVKPISGPELLNNGETSLYTVSPGTSVSSYNISQNPLPSTISSFQSGYLYEITYTNAASSTVTSKQLTRSSLGLW